MNRLPPSLLYFVIYNPTLAASLTSRRDDEDAEEQAHVLFYTANDHAVSRDRVLRQVGLAKALVNFASIFDPRAVCESVHSQSRRMVMVSPESNFWIHACFELERLPRAGKKDGKGKDKQKGTVYDYNEASLHDAALRSKLLLGYETFKVTHGSFSSILNTLGKEALELQLERFFTVWSWSWDLGKQLSFADSLGIRVHPLSNQLTPLFDTLEKDLPPHFSLLVVVSSCIVASKPSPLQHPLSLVRHLLSIADSRPPNSGKVTDGHSLEVDHESQSSVDLKPSGSDTGSRKNGPPNKRFLGVPGLNMNLNVNMDMRKWNWHDYITLGIGTSTSGSKAQINKAVNDTKILVSPVLASDAHGAEKEGRSLPAGEESDGTTEMNSESRVDSLALEEALSSDANSRSAVTHVEDTEEATEANTRCASELHTGALFESGSTEARAESGSEDEDVRKPPPEVLLQTEDVAGAPSGENVETGIASSQRKGRAPVAPQWNSFPSFLETLVHLPDPEQSNTRRRLVRYLRDGDCLLALLPSLNQDDDTIDVKTCQDLAERGVELINLLKKTAEVEQEKITMAFSSSPVQSVLQKLQHVIVTSNRLTYSSSPFLATSWYFHEGKKAFESEQDRIEIISRGQSPQDWHVVKHGLGAGTALHGDIYMEIGRKEASLVDVDNEVVAAIRRFLE
ncbi:hypothetical protein M0805_006898 [Coniferiporia weirii]|nr:hypothetical protein M0805_006898 [Coniferiporia weirii]